MLPPFSVASVTLWLARTHRRFVAALGDNLGAIITATVCGRQRFGAHRRPGALAPFFFSAACNTRSILATVRTVERMLAGFQSANGFLPHASQSGKFLLRQPRRAPLLDDAPGNRHAGKRQCRPAALLVGRRKRRQSRFVGRAGLGCGAFQPPQLGIVDASSWGWGDSSLARTSRKSIIRSSILMC